MKVGAEVKILNDDGGYAGQEGMIIEVDDITNDGLPYLVEFKIRAITKTRWCFANEVEEIK